MDTFTTSTAIDRDALLARLMDNAELANRLLGQFVDNAADEYDTMEAAARLGDAKTLRSLAHRHKGTAATLALPRVTARARQLEQDTESDSVDQWLQAIEELRDLQEEVRQAVQSEATDE